MYELCVQMEAGPLTVAETTIQLMNLATKEVTVVVEAPEYGTFIPDQFSSQFNAADDTVTLSLAKPLTTGALEQESLMLVLRVRGI